MEKFKEKKIVKICQLITVGLGILFMICLITPIVTFLLSIIWHNLADVGTYIFAFGMLSIPLNIPFLLISSTLSDKKYYTSQFLQYMREQLESATTLKELLELHQEFMYLATDGGMYCLSYPISLREIHKEIESKIDILEKQSKNAEYSVHKMLKQRLANSKASMKESFQYEELTNVMGGDTRSEKQHRANMETDIRELQYLIKQLEKFNSPKKSKK